MDAIFQTELAELQQIRDGKITLYTDDAFKTDFITTFDERVEIAKKILYRNTKKGWYNSKYMALPRRTRKQRFADHTPPAVIEDGKLAMLRMRPSHFIVNQWTDAEDQQLSQNVIKRLLDKKDHRAWEYYARVVFFGTKTATQCRQRWDRKLNPVISRHGKWTPNECISLVNFVKSTDMALHNRWTLISCGMNGSRAPDDCRRKWKRMVDIVARNTCKPSASIMPDEVLTYLDIRPQEPVTIDVPEDVAREMVRHRRELDKERRLVDRRMRYKMCYILPDIPRREKKPAAPPVAELVE